ncbi:uncharacterized protein N7483_002252 [Penicillium malachiteum]|uniref:uncharacterized protein n=1 Tax=Penicillium malachiteum TaxID=1324776 RepID=UPI002547621B|nr:uncharacterized protein N7483_002252 [Penicillium malachiteum]KAJ5737127.1 hypothetical protein N7483_002252 [Penicillium malachiteum]
MPNRNAGKKASARNFQQSDMATVARSTSLDRGTLLTSPPSPRAGPVIRSAEGAIPQRHTHYLHQKPNESTAAPVGMSKTPSIMDPVNAPPTIDPISTPQNMHPGNAPPMMRPINAPPIIHSDNAPQMMHPGNAPPTMHMGNAPPL